MDIQVIKKDGSLEPFNKEKVDRIMVAAGLDPDKSLRLAQNVYDWAINSGVDRIQSTKIRDKVVDELKKEDIYAANFYIWYEKTKSENSN